MMNKINRLDVDLANSAREKLKAGVKPTTREAAALNRLSKGASEETDRCVVCMEVNAEFNA